MVRYVAWGAKMAMKLRQGFQMRLTTIYDADEY